MGEESFEAPLDNDEITSDTSDASPDAQGSADGLASEPSETPETPVAETDAPIYNPDGVDTNASQDAPVYNPDTDATSGEGA